MEEGIPLGLGSLLTVTILTRMKRFYVTPFGYQTSEAMDPNKLEFSRTSMMGKGEDRKGAWCQPKEELVSWKEILLSSDTCQTSLQARLRPEQR